jgi:acetyl esterase/lipase
MDSPWTELGVRPSTGGGLSVGGGWVESQGPFFHEVLIDNPGTGWKENFIVHTPSQAHLDPRPLLVVFHPFGHTPMNIVRHTRFIQEAWRRGWYLVAPLSASKKHFSSMAAQVNTEVVLNWMLAHFAIDRTRIYGVGFSMGGGMATSFAARHLDPRAPMFAAIVNHTGSVSLKNLYIDDVGSRFFLDWWFNPTPGPKGKATCWNLARSSVFDFDPLDFSVNLSRNLARNLLHMGVRNTRASNDYLLPYLTVHMEELHEHMLQLGAIEGERYSYEVVPFDGHEWDMLNYRATLDWLAQFRLSLPRSGSTLADADGRFFFFDIVQDRANKFTPFRWAVDPEGNHIDFVDTRNLARAVFSLGEVGLDPLRPLTLSLGSMDDTGDQIRIDGYASTPSRVERDGAVTNDWSFDGAIGQVSLWEREGGLHDWTVHP